MSPEEKIEMGRKLIAEAEAEIAAKKRNWPEEIKSGMIFRHNGGALYVSCFPLGDERFSLVRLNSASKIWKSGTLCGLDGFGISGDKAFAYLGYACDLIRIADDAHEPTGAELVGKVCEYSDSGFTACMTAKSECRGIGPHGYMDSRGTWYRFARLTR